MANALTTGALLSAPTKNPHFSHDYCARTPNAISGGLDRAVQEYIATHGLQKLSDDAERQISRLLVKASH